MTPRRQQTPISYGSQPVRFYKIVALTFLFLTIVLLGVVIFMSSKRATITIITKSTPEQINESVDIGKDVGSRGVSGYVATKTIEIDLEKFQPTGNREEPGVATGKVTLHNDSSVAQPLVATTRLLTPNDILFRMKSGATVPANGTVEVEVYADKEGVTGDIGPVQKFTIPGLNETRQKEIYASSDVTMIGGTKVIGVLSEADIERAKKVVFDKAVETAKKDLAILYPEMSAEYSVANSSEAITDVEVGEEVSEFHVSMSVDVVGVFYELESLKEWADMRLANHAINDSELIRPSDELPTVTLEEYNSEDPDKATINILYNGLASLNPDSKEIDKMMFYGKNKDEVRRYLLSLSHVHNVEIDFRPAWMMTVPHVPDHINVIVRSVE
jgi:hypothetical protein